MTQTRGLGRLGREVTALGMGCWPIGGPWTFDGAAAGWGEVDDRESTAAIRTALDLGVTLFDTADVYGCGHSERVLGAAVAADRDSVVLATKVGLVFDEASRSGSGADAGAAHLRSAVRASLRRLGTDRIDICQLHAGADDAGQAADAVAVFEELVQEGSILAYGSSIDTPAVAEVFAAGPHCATIQHECNVFGTDQRLLDLCARSGVASLGRSPLAMGLLTGKYTSPADLPGDDVRRVTPHWDFFRPGAMEGRLRRLDLVRDVLTADGRTLAQGALAWVWARSPLTVPIPGFRTVAQVRDNAGALAHGPLTAGQVAEIDALLARPVPAG
jgi:aryl-alcohol dehydrogenase-like predicted oxidoreductase